MTVYPNPYLDVVNFDITTPESGKGTLQLYSLLGQRLSTVQGEFTAGISQTIICPMDFAHQQPVMYVFMIGKTKMQGTLMPSKL